LKRDVAALKNPPLSLKSVDYPTSLKKAIFVRRCTNAYVLLSSNALYLAPLGNLAIAVTYYLGGMAIAEDILRGDRAIFISRINFASPSGGPKVASKRRGINGGAHLFSRLWHHLRCA